MFASDVYLYQDKVARFIRGLATSRYAEHVALEAECAVCREPVPFDRREALAYHPVREGDIWGEDWDSAWFRLRCVVPESFAGRPLFLEVHLGGEALLFDAGGCPAFSFSAGSVFDAWYTRTHYAIPSAAAGERLDFHLEAAAQGQFGLRYTIGPEHPLGHQEARVNRLRLCTADPEVLCLHREMTFLFNMLGVLERGARPPSKASLEGLMLPSQEPDEQDYRHRECLTVLNDAVNAFDAMGSAAEARAVLRRLLNRHAFASATTAWSIGHAHIDVGWLWPIRESTRKAARTFASQIDILERFPDYVFGASQPYLYDQVKRNYPALYAKIKGQVAAGRWEPQGGMWVEPDCNVVGGESLVRQFLHGKRFFQEEFGVDVKTLWLPDVFGYPGNLPQIVRKAGCDFFMSAKLVYNRTNRFPYSTFRWEGIDGTSVLAHFPPADSYSCGNTPAELAAAQNRNRQSADSPDFLNLFGIGDGGGGPAAKHVHRARLARDFEGLPRVRFSAAAAFFDAIAPAAARFPVWRGELYFERHRGTFTTQSRAKRGNRLCEQALAALETFATFGPGSVYPGELLDRCWKLLLLNQFHDVIPGTSIHEIYDVLDRDYAGILDDCRAASLRVAGAALPPDGGAAAIVNTLAEPFSGCIALPFPNAVEDATGAPIPCQLEDGRCVAFVHVGGLASASLRKRPEPAPTRTAGSGLVLENASVRYAFDAHGALVSAFDKTASRELLSGPGNLLKVYQDRYHDEDAWDIEPFYGEIAPTVLCGEPSPNPGACGPARQSLAFHYRFGESSLTQRVSLAPEGKRLDFATEVDWHGEREMLRVEFPVRIHTAEMAFDIQFGTIRRPLNANTSWEQAKFEAVGQRFADLSDSGHGVALLNDCKYGYALRPGFLDLCLLRSTKHPDFFADLGRQTFTYAFLPHERPLDDSDVFREAAALNRAPMIFDGFRAPDVGFPIRVVGDAVSLAAVKRAEDGGGIVVRLWETRGRATDAVLELSPLFASVQEVDLLERPVGAALPLAGSACAFAMGPYEIKSILLRP